MSEESDRMVVLLQELAVLKKAVGSGKDKLITKKRRREISDEMKRLASQARTVNSESSSGSGET